MNFIIHVNDLHHEDLGRAGGKAHALAVMTQKGIKIPEAITITTDAYNAYVTETGLRTKIMMELNRKTMTISAGRSSGTYASRGFHELLK